MTPDTIRATCPHCKSQLNAPIGVVACGCCGHEFEVRWTAPVPFFKSSRRKVLKLLIDNLTLDGELSDSDKNAIEAEVARLGLNDAERDKLRLDLFQERIAPIKAEIESRLSMSPEQERQLERLGEALGINVQGDQLYAMCRTFHAIESECRLPPHIANTPGFLPQSGEEVYAAISTTWAQLRVHRNGYRGTSVSIPIFKGLRYRVGNYTPMTNEELTDLASGMLYVTDKRLYFDGDRRNNTSTHRVITGTTIYKDGIEVETTRQRSDFYRMDVLNARFVDVLVRRLNAG